MRYKLRKHPILRWDVFSTFSYLLMSSFWIQQLGYSDHVGQVKSESVILEKGERITLKAEDREDLSRDILKVIYSYRPISTRGLIFRARQRNDNFRDRFRACTWYIARKIHYCRRNIGPSIWRTIRQDVRIWWFKRWGSLNDVWKIPECELKVVNNILIRKEFNHILSNIYRQINPQVKNAERLFPMTHSQIRICMTWPQPGVIW